MPAITTPDDLLRLAPDAKSLEAGRKLFYSRRWRLVGGDGQWLWGEFVYGPNPQGKAIESAVALTTGRFVCSCRGRQRPCAHGLALVLMLKNAQERIAVAQPPSWVRSVQFQAEKVVKPVSNILAADDRLDARLELMTSGVEELDIRLLDIARRGIADTLAQGPEPFRTAAARLTDAKLPGPAGRLRRLAALISQADGYRDEADVARILGDLYLFVRAWKNKEKLSVAQHDELLQYAGMTTRKEDILSRPGLADHWLVMGVVAGQEEKLRFRRTWLRGEKSRRFALLVDYAFGEQAFERSWPLAAAFEGKVHFYPGSYPQRAVFPQPVPGGRPYDGLTGYTTFAALRANYQKALTANPWLLSYPVYLQGMRPVKNNRQLLLLDESGETAVLAKEYDNFYTLLAISGGGPMSVFGEFDGYQVLPLSVVTGNGLVEA
jgi:hypothetical protein